MHAYESTRTLLKINADKLELKTIEKKDKEEENDKKDSDQINKSLKIIPVLWLINII